MHLGSFLRQFRLVRCSDFRDPAATYNVVHLPADVPIADSILQEIDHEIGDANLISSLYSPSRHKVCVCLDIDLPCMLLESSNGNHHLLIDHLVDEADYWALLDLLSKMGLVQQGYVEKAKVLGASYVRTPWTTKDYDPCSGGTPSL